MVHTNATLMLLVVVLAIVAIGVERCTLVRQCISNYWTPSIKCVPILSTPMQYTTILPTRIPVFMYWHSDDLPPTVRLCLQNWRYFTRKSVHNFEVVLVTHTNVAELIDARHPCISEAHEYPAMKSDFIRLALLQKYGGVYMDASVILTEPLDWIIGDGTGHNYFQAFVNQRNMNISCQVPVVETSFLAAPPNHPLISAWFKELQTLRYCTGDTMSTYVAEIPLQKNLDGHYHIAYHALTKVLIKTPLKDFPNVFLINHSSFLNSLSNGNVKVLIQKTRVNYHRILKLVGEERKQMDSFINERKFEVGSFALGQVFFYTTCK